MERSVRVLIVEDDPLIAMDLQCIVEGCGHEVSGPCDSLAEARRHLDDDLDFALLDIDLPDGKSFGFAAQLDARRVPYTFVSASRQAELPADLRHAGFIAKPYRMAAIRDAFSLARPLAS